ncbi:unnamed protein product [Calicophoron daubneyi]|uniref:Uncharacterized protein n=1 Tax=Calicophoron daubneyi TaxID=300641 RepID=A0AAV2TGA9_CALDB
MMDSSEGWTSNIILASLKNYPSNMKSVAPLRLSPKQRAYTVGIKIFSSVVINKSFKQPLAEILENSLHLKPSESDRRDQKKIRTREGIQLREIRNTDSVSRCYPPHVVSLLKKVQVV